MSGLSGHYWAVNGPGKDGKDEKKEEEKKEYLPIPYFDFIMPPSPAKKTVTTVLDGTPASDPVPIPTAPQVTAPVVAPSAPIPQPLSPAVPADASTTKSEEASEKLLSKAELAAAATRARMAEILGTECGHGSSSGSKK